MYAEMTDRAGKAMWLADKEARAFNHEYVGTEHILLGLAKEGSGVAANVLKNLGLRDHFISLAITKLVPPRPGKGTPGHLPLSPQAKGAMKHALDEQRNLNRKALDTEHLLLGLLSDPENMAVRILTLCGIDPERLRQEVLTSPGPQPARHGMIEYDLFVPLRYNDGTPVEEEKLERLRRRLVDQFGGLTDLYQRHQGYWKIGGVTFRDEIVIYRVLADETGAAREFFRRLKEELKTDLHQDDVLIVERQVEVI